MRCRFNGDLMQLGAVVCLFEAIDERAAPQGDAACVCFQPVDEIAIAPPASRVAIAACIQFSGASQMDIAIANQRYDFDRFVVDG
jgi:hypothetical protein